MTNRLDHKAPSLIGRKQKFNCARTGVAVGMGMGLFMAMANPAEAQTTSYELTPAWSIEAGGEQEWASIDNTHRGLAYNPVTGNVLTTSRFPGTTAAVYILDGETGALEGNLSVEGVKTDINFPINLVGVAEDGVIYGTSLTVNSTLPAGGNNGPFRIYRWESESAEPELVYEADPADGDLNTDNLRFGDSLAVRGSGENTQILAGTRRGDHVALFTTADGTTFTHTRIYVPEIYAASAGNTQTIAWGEGDTFYTKTDSGAQEGQLPLQHFSLDVGSGMATLTDGHLNLAARLGGIIGFDAERNLLAILKAISIGTHSTHQLRLFEKSDLGLDKQDVTMAYRSFPTENVNGNGTGAIAFGADKLFALDSNNGIIAFHLAEKEIQTQIFWAEDGGFSAPNLGSVWRANADGSEKVEIATAVNRPVGLDIDPINKHVYWTEDGAPGRIVRANFDGSEPTVLFSGDVLGFSNAQMLQLDLENGKVYWTGYNHGVMRGNLDGTGFELLGGLDGSSVQYTAIDLDLANGHIYYNDPTQMGVLLRMDLDGANRVELTRNVSTIDSWHFNTIDLDLANNNIYYADAGTHDIKRMDIDGMNPLTILNDPGAVPFGVAKGPDNTLYWLARAQRIASAKIDGSELNPQIVDIGLTPFGIALYSAPVGGAEPADITNISVDGATVTITWEGGAGSFQLQRRADLGTESWEDVGTATSSFEATDTVTGGAMFYRVVTQE